MFRSSATIIAGADGLGEAGEEEKREKEGYLLGHNPGHLLGAGRRGEGARVCPVG